MKLVLFGFSVLIIYFFDNPQQKKPLKYISFGDSYTICTGTTHANERWPNLLTAHLNEAGIATTLHANPSRNGFSTQDVIDNELPLLKTDTIDFATLLIGVNDWVREVDSKTFQKNLCIIIDRIQKNIRKKNQLVLITIPDFGVTPQGAIYGKGRDISKGISEFNGIIKSESIKRGLACVDIFAISKQMKTNKDLVAQDGLHPSAKEYAIWEGLILPEVKKILEH